MSSKNDIDLVELFCMTDDLRCYDPYDVWMTDFGIGVKQLYNSNKIVGILPAMIVTIWDQFLNNKSRFGYIKQEYPTVRAMAALALLNLYQKTGNQQQLVFAKKHIDWLIANTSSGYSGLCWGLGFKWAAGDGLDYNENTPFSTHTPYALEAIHRYIEITGDLELVVHVKSIFEFYENDIQIMCEDEDSLATSYGPDKDRLVTNAVSYTLYAYAIFSKYMPDKEAMIIIRIQKLFSFISKKQLTDGSWLYEPNNPNSFIDCFHTCFVLKNIFKTSQIIHLEKSEQILISGYNYIKKNFYNPKHALFKRFTLSNKPSVIKFDLYDNAEVLHLAFLLGDRDLEKNLASAIQEKFVSGKTIYSVIDIFNSKGNKNTLRWAVMPYIYALSANYKHVN